MKKTLTFGLFVIGILMYPLFPGNGIQVLLTKLLERVLFSSFDNSIISYVISSSIGLIIAIYLFNFALNKLLNSDFTISGKIKTWIKYGISIHVFLFCIWFTIPFIDNWLGVQYNSNLVSNYASLKPITYLSTPIIQAVSFIAGLWLVYRKVNIKAEN